MARMRIVRFSELNANGSFRARDYTGPSAQDVERQEAVVRGREGRLAAARRKLDDIKAERDRFAGMAREI